MPGQTYMGIPREENPWYPTIDPDLCMNCGNCMEFCSNGVFSMDADVMQVVEPYNCVVGCDMCKTDCPTEAISFPEKGELIRVLRKLREEFAR